MYGNRRRCEVRKIVFSAFFVASMLASAGTNTMTLAEIVEQYNFAMMAETNDFEVLDAQIKKARIDYIRLLKMRNKQRKGAAKEDVVEKTRRSVGKANIFTKDQKKFFDNRRICVKRDTETIPGSVITTWYRNGKLDTKSPAVITNTLKRISGVVQNNPLRDRIDNLLVQVTNLTFRISSLDLQITNLSTQVTNLNIRAAAAEARASIAEARVERAERFRSWLIEQRDKTPLQTVKAIYQAIIDKLDEDD